MDGIMKLEKLPNSQSIIANAKSEPFEERDSESPILHVLPKLLVPVELLEDGLKCEEITLTVTSTLPVNVVPKDGITIRQPYQNQRYFVGGTTLLRHGWIVPIPADVTEFDIEFQWYIRSAALWQVSPQEDWQVRHLIHISLHAGKGLTYTMDGSCWPEKKGPAIHTTPISILGFDHEYQIDPSCRQIIKEAELIHQDKELDGDLAGYFLEEQVNITGIPHEDALKWSINAFQKEQLHEIKQTATFTRAVDAHRANGPIEMPAKIFVQAITYAQEIGFDQESEFFKTIAGIPGGLEQHPAMKILCDWWETVRPDGEPFKPGVPMPMVRVCDDDEYWWADRDVPNSPVNGFNSSGRDAARIGDQILVLFQAKQEHAVFDKEGMTVFLPSGKEFNFIGIDKEDFTSGRRDEARYSLRALADFPAIFPSAWEYLNKVNEASDES